MENHELKHEILKRNIPVPRYTSYPTAPHFKPSNTNEECINWIQNLKASSKISLYIHIPFCPKLCYYCGCNTKVTNSYSPISDYLKALINEISVISETLTNRHTVDHIHFGGGSPTILNPDDFSLIIEALKTNFNVKENADIAIEIDPRQLSEGKVATYAKHGVNRASLGVQDFNQKVMTSVNRTQPFHLTYQAINLLNEYDITNINIDLMYGLPYQTNERIKRTADLAAALKPKRIALFGYAHVPWMKKHMQLIDINTLPNASDRFDLFTVSSGQLIQHGYHQVGIDHFAFKNDELFKALENKTLRRNFQGYTADNSDAVIGIGNSAISSFPQGYYQNTVEQRNYIDIANSKQFPISKSLSFTKKDRMIADIIQQLMCYQTVNIKYVCEMYGYTENDLDFALHRLQPLIADKLVFFNQSSGELKIPNRSLHATRLICSCFDEYFKDPHPQSKKHSSMV
jgi:oxygen-independent coproporphyrinogen-3 oxidase